MQFEQPLTNYSLLCFEAFFQRNKQSNTPGGGQRANPLKLNKQGNIPGGGQGAKPPEVEQTR